MNDDIETIRAWMDGRTLNEEGAYAALESLEAELTRLQEENAGKDVVLTLRETALRKATALLELIRPGAPTTRIARAALAEKEIAGQTELEA